MKMLTLSLRNTKEIARDPLNIVFGVGFPIILLLLLSAIQANVPVELFAIERLAPGISIFGLSFMTLFSATLISRDRESALLTRLYSAPLSARDFILGYLLPMVPLSLLQSVVCYLVAFLLGMKMTPKVLLALLLIIPCALFFISLGLLFGSILNDKQVGGICGALLTNLSAWLSGIWFDLELVGGAFKKIAYALPFVHSVEMQRAIISGEYGDIWIHLLVVAGYAILTTVAAIALFVRQMKKK